MKNKFNEDSYLKEVSTKIKSIFSEDEKNCVQLEDNIFYPQGGGQKGDSGMLIIAGKNLKVVNTVKDKYSDEGILLITEEKLPDDTVGSEILCKLDWDFRYKQMKLHTAVHLHHCIIEKVAGKKVQYPQTSDIQDGFAFNRYEKDVISQDLVELANNEFRKVISEGAEVKTYTDAEKEGFRWWECLGFKIPCGGTHVANISEIGEVGVTYSQKKGKSTVNISLVK